MIVQVQRRGCLVKKNTISRYNFVIEGIREEITDIDIITVLLSFIIIFF